MKPHATFNHKGKDETAYRDKRGKISEKRRNGKE
jgi:hypothetical protein